MPREANLNPERKGIQREIDRLKQLIRTRERGLLHGRYLKEEVHDLRMQMEELKRERDKINTERRGHRKESYIDEVEVAKELHYPASVIIALQNEPDPDKRQEILRKTRVNGW